MKFINIGLIASISFFSCAPHSTLMTNTGIPSIKSKINKLIAESDLDVSLGIKVISVEDDKTLYELNSNKLFMPASNNKLYTCAAALHYLGRDHIFKTTILKNNNDLVLKGGGDPDLSIDQLDSLANTAAKIIEDVNTLYLDATLLDSMYYGKGWMWDEGSWWYAAPIGALSVNDNCIDFHIEPGNLGEPARIDHFPKTEYISQSNKTTTVENNTELKKLKIERDWVGRTNHFSITGEIVISDSIDTLQRNVHDPTLFTGTLFKESLAKYGVQVGHMKRGTKVNESETIAIHYSDPLIASATNLMNESDNLTAELLIKIIGRGNQIEGNWKDGLDSVKTLLSDSAGIDTSRIRLVDGSGVSRYNLTSPDQLTRFLKWSFNSKYKDDFISTLASGGNKDGTMEKRLEKEGNLIRAKTGGLSGVSNLSGYIFSPKHGPLAFSILISGYTGSSYQAIQLQNKIVQLFAHD
jgi:D-alanyl-D-alanine carboxypeptidase/D-alanyl-D-alanine-endopeptidase (penicillin-binding protein 4)